MKEDFIDFFRPLLSPSSYFDSVLVENEKSPTLTKLILLSWAFKFLQTLFYLMVLSLFSHLFFEMLGEQFRVFFGQASGESYSMLTIFLGLETIFFPLLCLVVVKLWTFIIGIFAKFLKYTETDTDFLSHEIAKASLSSNALLWVPMFGDFLQKITGMIIIFSGVKKGLGRSNIEALLIVLTPYIFLIMVSIIFIVLGFSLIF